MNETKEYPALRVVIRHLSTFSKWTTTTFEGEDEHTMLFKVLGSLGETTRVTFQLIDGTKLFLPKGVLQECTFTVKEDK